MDPFSFTASLVAVAAVPKTIYCLAKTARSIVRDFKTVGEELPWAVEQVTQSATIIDTAQGTLQMYCESREASGSKVISYIEEKRVAGYLQRQSLHIENHVQQLNEKMASLLGGLAIWVVLRWRYSLKGELEKLLVQMQFIQHNLTLLLGTIQLEWALRRGKSDEIEM